MKILIGLIFLVFLVSIAIVSSEMAKAKPGWEDQDGYHEYKDGQQ